MRAVVVACALVALAGCEKSEPKPKPRPAPVAEAEPPASSVPPEADVAPGPGEVDRIMKEVMVMIREMGDAAERGGTDCDKVTAEIGHVFDAHSGLIALARRYKDNAEMERAASDWMRDHQDEVTKPMQKMAVAASACATHPAFSKLLERLEG